MTDFRQLNEITVGNSYPLPLTTDIIDAVATAKYITAIDLKTGFYEIPMDLDDTHKTSFAGPYGHYEYRRMGYIVLPVQTLPFQHPALRQKPRFGETPTDTTRDSESNLDDIAEQPDTARPKSPVAKIADSNEVTSLLRGLPVLEQEIRYRKGEFLAVRNTDNGIFLCQETRPIIGTEPQTRIRWLTQTEANSNTYVFDYHDYMVPQCILEVILMCG